MSTTRSTSGTSAQGARDLGGRAVPIDEDGCHRFQPIQSHTARPMTKFEITPARHEGGAADGRA
jgi:hypothetical protein